jgi:hypothetical protein
VRLYHFTTALLTDQIKRVGIWRGDVPLTPASQKGEESMAIPSGMGVNLTGDPDFNNQRWAAGASIDKLSVRVCVEIPDEQMEHLWKWDYMCKVMIDRYGEQPFRVPDWKDGIHWDKDGRMIRDEEGHPVVSKWQEDRTVTLADWYKGMNMDCDHSKWYVFDGEIRPEWITEISERQERSELRMTSDILTPSAAIAWLEQLCTEMIIDSPRIADISTMNEGRDKWSSNGIKSVAKTIGMANMYLWKSSLMANAGTGAEAFDGTAFDVLLPQSGVVFIPDRELSIKQQDIEGQTFDLEHITAMVLTPVSFRGGKFQMFDRDSEFMETRSGDPVADGNYVSGLIVHRPSHDPMNPDLPWVCRAIPMIAMGAPCIGWSSLIKALFMFMEQKIVAVDRHRPPRHERRRLKKERRPIWDIKVVSLRRYAPSQLQEAGVGGVDWQCQWTVSGHWRKQPTNDGVKVIWIDPYIKGPEDKPLRDPTKSLFSVRR